MQSSIRIVVLLLSCLSLGGCISTALGVAAGTTAAVAGAVITAPIKIGGAVVDAVSDDDCGADDDDACDD